MSERCAGSGQPGHVGIASRTVTCLTCEQHFYSSDGQVPEHTKPRHEPYDHPYGDQACAACHDDWPCLFEQGRRSAWPRVSEPVGYMVMDDLGHRQWAVSLEAAAIYMRDWDEKQGFACDAKVYAVVSLELPEPPTPSVEPQPEPQLPGVPLTSGFDYDHGQDMSLSPEARKRVQDKVDSSNEARRKAAAAASTYVVGAAPQPEPEPLSEDHRRTKDRNGEWCCQYDGQNWPCAAVRESSA